MNNTQFPGSLHNHTEYSQSQIYGFVIVSTKKLI